MPSSAVSNVPWLPKPPLLLFLGWLILLGAYRLVALQTTDSPLHVRDNVCFRSDTKRALGDLAGARLQDHNHTTGHPNFVILHQPLGNAIREAYRANDKNLKPAAARRLAGPWVTAAGGAGAVIMLFLCLRLLLPVRRSLWFALIFATSASTVFYASVPETYIFSSLGICAMAWAALRQGKGGAFAWQAAVVYAVSNLTVNIVPAAIWSLLRFQGPRWWKKTLAAFLVSGAALVVLSLLQRAIYPQTSLFFLPGSVSREAGWLTWEHLSTPWHTLRILLQHLFLTNIVAPEPVVVEVLGLPMASVEAGNWAMLKPSFPLLALWILVLAAAAWGLRQRASWTPALLAAAAVLAFNLCFFSVFGHDRMLYAALWTPMTILLAAAGTETFLRQYPALAKIWDCALFVLCAGMAWHHWHFMGKLSALVPA
jgi:hypothetical protein